VRTGGRGGRGRLAAARVLAFIAVGLAARASRATGACQDTPVRRRTASPPEPWPSRCGPAIARWWPTTSAWPRASCVRASSRDRPAHRHGSSRAGGLLRRL